MHIYKLTNTETGAVLEGTAQELAEELGLANSSSLRQAHTRGQRVRHVWSVECLGEACLLPEHAKRLGLVKVCPICGKTFKAKRKRDYCCSQVCTRMNNSKMSAEWYRTQVEIYREQAEINRSVKTPRPRKGKNLTVAEINKRARAEHLTYGQYVAKYGL